MVNSYHQKTFAILKSNIMSKLNVKILQCKQNIWKGNYKFDDGLLSEEHLDNTDNDNDDDDESSSDNEEMKKMKPLSSQNAILCFLFNTLQLRKLKFDDIQIF